MKKAVALVLLTVILCGCGSKNVELERAMAFRAKLLAADGCAFDAQITADYGDSTHEFSVRCTCDEKGNVTFTVCQPESISGITGTLSADGGKLTFDDTAVAFPLLADGQLTPVSGPWILMKTLRGGYVVSCGDEGELLQISVDDSYANDAMNLDIWLDENDAPIRAEILYKQKRILSLDINNFRIL